MILHETGVISGKRGDYTQRLTGRGDEGVRVEEQELSSHPLTEIDDTGVKLHREGEKKTECRIRARS